MIRTVLELDLVGFTDIATALEESLDVQAVRSFQDQIQRFVDQGLAAVGLEREEVVLGTAGDNAILIFESAEQMHRFAEVVQHACLAYNQGKTTPLSRRWFRMGAATGEVEIDREQHRIIGITIARAVRLEAASRKGVLLIDAATFAALPVVLRQGYGPPHTVRGKREERYIAHSFRFIEERLVNDRRWLARHRAAYLAMLAVALVGIGLTIAFWPWRKSIPSNPTAANPIHGEADLRIFNSERADRDDRPISHPKLLPLGSGDRVRLEVRLDRPAYIYILWIAPSLEVLPVYPWKPGDWTSVKAEQARATLIFPDENSNGFPMKENKDGREIFLALARSEPLPVEVDLKNIVGRCVKSLPIRNPTALVRFREREVKATLGEDREPDFFLPDDTKDPFRNMADAIKRELSPHFEFVDGIAFASNCTSK